MCLIAVVSGVMLGGHFGDPGALPQKEVLDLLRKEVFLARQELRRRWFATPHAKETRSREYRDGQLVREVMTLERRSGDQVLWATMNNLDRAARKASGYYEKVLGMNRQCYFELGRKEPGGSWYLQAMSPRPPDRKEDKKWWDRHALASVLEDGNAPRPPATPSRLVIYDTEDFDRLADAPGFVLLDGRYADANRRYLEIKYRAHHPVPLDPQKPTETECSVKLDTQRAYQEVAFSRSYRPNREPEKLVSMTITWELDEAGGLPFSRQRLRTTVNRDASGKEDKRVHEAQTSVAMGPFEDSLFSPSAFGVPDLAKEADAPVSAPGVPWTIYGVAVGFGLLIVCILLSRRKAAAGGG